MKSQQVTSTVTALIKRNLASPSFSSGTTTVTGPSAKPKSWESGAQLVKNTQVDNQYLEHIRDVHDPSLHLKTIEDELKGTIGKALGKQGEKILAESGAMDRERRRYEELLETHGPSSRVVREAAQAHNIHRKQGIHARWELMVHRQAVGFVVGNHKYVMENYPIGEPLPEDDAVAEEDKATKEKKKKFGDQLDWWEKIGRWR